LLALTSAAAPPALGDAAADALFRDYAAPDGPGASVLVARGNTVLYAKSFGLADLERRAPADRATKFRLASCTKQFTAAAILILESTKPLALDDPASKYLPELPPYAKGVTIRHLLTHSGGLPDYEDLIPKERTSQVSDRDALLLMASAKELL